MRELILTPSDIRWLGNGIHTLVIQTKKNVATEEWTFHRPDSGSAPWEDSIGFFVSVNIFNYRTVAEITNVTRYWNHTKHTYDYKLDLVLPARSIEGPCNVTVDLSQVDHTFRQDIAAEELQRVIDTMRSDCRSLEMKDRKPTYSIMTLLEYNMLVKRYRTKWEAHNLHIRYKKAESEYTKRSIREAYGKWIAKKNARYEKKQKRVVF